MLNFTELADKIKQISADLGFDAIGIADLLDPDPKRYFTHSLRKHSICDMHYLLNNVEKRLSPRLLVPFAKTAICCLSYYPAQKCDDTGHIATDQHIASYALCRDYHKVMRKKLMQFAKRLQSDLGFYNFNYRVFCDSAPVLEKPLAAQAGLGWIGKNTLLVTLRGSYLFLGEIYTDLNFPAVKNKAYANHCVNCQRCINSCPTKALYAPYKLNISRCIAYLTIEHKGSIPKELRPLMGTRIFGCDACQEICPWNKFAPQINADSKCELLIRFKLHELMMWNESEFLEYTAGTSIHRIGHERWLRNIAVALGNAPISRENLAALEGQKNHQSNLVREHVEWALKRFY